MIRAILCGSVKILRLSKSHPSKGCGQPDYNPIRWLPFHGASRRRQDGDFEYNNLSSVEKFMRFKAHCVCLTMILLLLSGCTAEPDPAPQAGVEAAGGVDGTDPLSGTWTGDWGPSPTDRNPVVLELAWDGARLSGTVNPGPNAVELTNAAFDPVTQTVTMEADVEGFFDPFHYMIEGTLDGNMISGSWGHDDVSGDFTITMN